MASSGRLRWNRFGAGDYLLYLLMIIWCFITLYPVLYIISYSFSSPFQAAKKIITFYPRGFTLMNFQAVFNNRIIFRSFLVSVARTVVGVVYTCTICGLAAYAMTMDFPGKRVMSTFLLIPMYLSGGLLPFYVLIYKLGLINSFWVYILPSGFSMWNMMLMRTYFQGIPDNLGESARLDGAGELRIFFTIILPLSAPIFATIALFAGVAQWNEWFYGMIFMTSNKFKPMATIIVDLMQRFEGSELQRAIQQGSGAVKALGEERATPETIKMATIVICTAPIMFTYPFLQKHFIKGVMIGAVKA